MNYYKISILIAMYNSAPYISRCINSLLSQNYENFEIIVVNDGSTDNSLKIVKSFKDKRIRVITTENKGLAHARNVGIENCRGDYFCFIDSDDYVENDYISILLNGALKYNCACCFSGAKLKRLGKITKEVCYQKEEVIKYNHSNILDNNIIHLNSGIFLSKECSGVFFDESCPAYAEDYIYKIKILNHLGEAAYVLNSPYIYTDDNALSITSNNDGGKWGIRALCLIRSKVIIFNMFKNDSYVCRRLSIEALNILIMHYVTSKKWKIVFKKSDYKECISGVLQLKKFLPFKSKIILYIQLIAPIVNYIYFRLHY